MSKASAEDSSIRIRLAVPEDDLRLRQAFHFSLTRPEGKRPKSSFLEGINRNEILVLERYDRKAKDWSPEGFVEWHMRTDDSVTIRDLGTGGEAPNIVACKALVREMISLVGPLSIQVKVREDQLLWNSIFEDLPGFEIEGREFSRPHWKNVWSWQRRH